MAIVLSIFCIIVGLSLSDSNFKENTSDVEPIVKADVIMPTKVSRPGCDVKDICYIPSSIVTQKGKSITWINEDSSFHTVTSGFYGEPTDLFDSGYLDPYQTYTLYFDESGVYDYFCTLHPWMKAQVIVE